MLSLRDLKEIPHYWICPHCGSPHSSITNEIRTDFDVVGGTIFTLYEERQCLDCMDTWSNDFRTGVQNA